jgi:hypothetical protein
MDDVGMSARRRGISLQPEHVIARPDAQERPHSGPSDRATPRATKQSQCREGEIASLCAQ